MLRITASLLLASVVEVRPLAPRADELFVKDLMHQSLGIVDADDAVSVAPDLPEP